MELNNNILEKLDAIGLGDENGEIMQQFASLMNLPDEQFKLVAPTILDSIERSLNTPESRLLFVQSLQSAGLKGEDIEEQFLKGIIELDEKESDLSQIKRDFFKNFLSIFLNAVNETEGVAKRTVRIPFEKLDETVKTPAYAHLTDSGLDVFAVEEMTINPGETVLMPTGIKVAIPNGYELQVRPKSGRALKTKLRIANTPGTIDAGYRDEIKIIVENIEPAIKDITYEFDDNGGIHITSILHGSSYTIGKGEKFAQLVLMEVPKAAFYEVESIGNEDDRGGGFGSTGLK